MLLAEQTMGRSTAGCYSGGGPPLSSHRCPPGPPKNSSHTILGGPGRAGEGEKNVGGFSVAQSGGWPCGGRAVFAHKASGRHSQRLPPSDPHRPDQTHTLPLFIRH